MVSLELIASPMGDDDDVTLYPLPTAEQYAGKCSGAREFW
jgi:hypothetical protein